jgi:hypothetical protein
VYARHGDTFADLFLKRTRVGGRDEIDRCRVFLQEAAPPAARFRRVGSLGIGQAESIFGRAGFEATRNRDLGRGVRLRRRWS